MDNYQIDQVKPSIYKLKPGDLLVIYPNDHNLYVVVQGLMVVNKLFSNGEKFSLDLIQTGYVIKKMFKPKTRYNYCYEITPLELTYIINISGTEKYLSQQYYRHYFSDDTHSRISFTGLYAQKNIKNRIIHLLLLLSEVTGHTIKTSLILHIELPYKLIATITGSTRNTVSKIINQMEADHILSYYSRQIIIHDLSILHQYSTGIVPK
uniref:Global nitrogen transcriptional regulator n=1 Tax=Izziella formosana TaxID=1653389 RepID=A0A1G4NUZ3_9FLOR|nr:Global nitrogen transcriptional regulator [Izziella formosana]SCW22457.1 Global nitrogen transcriptional regulator [Izziella formosana]